MGDELPHPRHGARLWGRAPVVGLALALLVPGSPPSLSAQSPRVLPIDEAAKDPAFFAFRARLQRAVAERDTAALLAVVHPEIKLSFGGDHGFESFRERWLSEPATSDPATDIWAELGAVLALGGRFYDDSTFAAPYTFTDSPDEVDPFEAMIALGDVPVHAAPETNADTIAILSFAVVRHEWRADPGPPQGWTAVRLDDGRRATCGRARCGARSITGRSSRAAPAGGG